ncbi:MAG: hypothetical protein NC417_14715 [Candidatus Gastranaerophilales bacterium]|nr:hypothetical protein [Candidatus Gastranaerophilales bacterium]
MDKIIYANGYGICLFSANTLEEFLKREKIRKRKLLSLLQQDKELYLTTQKEGIWVPLVQINSYNYAIKLAGWDEPFDEQWEQKIDYDGFNLEIKDGLWISAISQLEHFAPLEYHVEKEEFYRGKYGQERYRSPWEHWYKTLDGIYTNYTDIKYDVPAGKYLLSIQGYVRKEQMEFPTPNCGFFFSLTKVEAFESFKNPRESDDYDFNVGSMK